MVYNSSTTSLFSEFFLAHSSRKLSFFFEHLTVCSSHRHFKIFFSAVFVSNFSDILGKLLYFVHCCAPLASSVLSSSDLRVGVYNRLRKKVRGWGRESKRCTYFEYRFKSWLLLLCKQVALTFRLSFIYIMIIPYSSSFLQICVMCGFIFK